MKLPPYYAPLPYYAVCKALFFNLGTRAIKGMTVGGMTECPTVQYNYNFLKLRFRIRSCFIMHLGKGLNTVQIFKGHLRREGIIPELIIYTVLDISLELKS